MRKLWIVLAVCTTASAHDIITTKITWNTDIARIVFSRCASCHRPGGEAFSLLTYKEARPWAVAIKEEILTRRMPPWGAAKGFGEFRNDDALSPEEIERFVSWIDGGVPEEPQEDATGTGQTGAPGAQQTAAAAPASRPAAVPTQPVGPPEPPVFTDPEPYARSSGEITVSGEFELSGDFQLDGLWPETVPDGASIRVLAQLPDGIIEPLLWLDGYQETFSHPFLLRRPMTLPKGTMIHGVPEDAKIALLPVEAGNTETAKAR